MEVSIIQKQEDKDTDKLHDVQRLFSSKYYLTFPQYGKYPWIGVFKSKRLGLGGCAGILVQTLLPPLLISWSKDTAATYWLIRLFKLWHRSRLIDSQKVAMTYFSKLYILAFPQYGKYPWIGVFKLLGIFGNRLGGCAGTLVAANW